MLQPQEQAVESGIVRRPSAVSNELFGFDAMDEYDVLADQLGDLWHNHRAEFFHPTTPPTAEFPFLPALVDATQTMLEQVLETTFEHVAVPNLPINERTMAGDNRHRDDDNDDGGSGIGTNSPAPSNLIDWLASRQELRDIYREKLPGIAIKLLTRLRMAGHLPTELSYEHPPALAVLSPDNFRRFLASHKLKDRSPILPLLRFAEPEPIAEDVAATAKMFKDYLLAIDRKIDTRKDGVGWRILDVNHESNRFARRTAIKKICRSLMSRRASPLQPVIKRFRSMEVLQKLAVGNLPEQISRFAEAGHAATVFGVLTNPKAHFQGESIRHQIVRTFTNLSLNGGIVKWRVVQTLIGATAPDVQPEAALRDFVMLAATIPNEEVVPDCALTYQDLLTFLNGGNLR